MKYAVEIPFSGRCSVGIVQAAHGIWKKRKRFFPPVLLRLAEAAGGPMF